jgi:hypothetical protein
MDKYKQHEREWRIAYQKISSLTRIPIEDLVSRCLVLVKDGNSTYYGWIGILDDHNFNGNRILYNVNFGKKKKTRFDLEFSSSDAWKHIEEKLFYTPNAPLLLEERDRMGKLTLD